MNLKTLLICLLSMMIGFFLSAETNADKRLPLLNNAQVRLYYHADFSAHILGKFSEWGETTGGFSSKNIFIPSSVLYAQDMKLEQSKIPSFLYYLNNNTSIPMPCLIDHQGTSYLPYEIIK